MAQSTLSFSLKENRELSVETSGRSHQITGSRRSGSRSGNGLKTSTFKVIFLGDPSVGKTSVALFYLNKKVQCSTLFTIGFDIRSQDVIINGIPSTLQIWDTAGMEKFRNGLITQYYRNIDGVIFVYDITRRDTFINVDSWLKEMKRYSESDNKEPIILVLIGNQNDREDEREVSTNEGQLYANQHGMIFTELSAKNLRNLDTLDSVFVRLSEQMIAERFPENDWIIISEGPIPEYSENTRQHCHC